VAWRFFTSSQAFRNTPLLAAGKEVARERGRQVMYFNETVGAAEQSVINNMRKQGIKISSLDPKKAPLRHRQVVQDLDAAIHGRLSGLDEGRDITKGILERKQGVYQVEGVEGTIKANSPEEARDVALRLEGVPDNPKVNVVRGQEPKIDLTKQTVRQEAIMDTAAADAIIVKYGAQDLVGAYRSYYDEMAKRLFLRDDLLEGVNPEGLREILSSPESVRGYIDEDKITNLWRSNANRKIDTPDGKEHLFSLRDDMSDNPGVRMVQETMNLIRGDSAFPAITEGAEGVSEVVSELMSFNLGSGFYHPKVYDNVDSTGRSLLLQARKLAGKPIKEQAQAIAAGHTMPQYSVNTFSEYSLEDLTTLRRLSGGRDDILQQIGDAETRLLGGEVIGRTGEVRTVMGSAERASKDGTTAVVSRLGAHDAGRFYSGNSASSYALFIHGSRAKGVNPETGRVVREYTDAWDETTSSQRNAQRYYDTSKESKAAGNRHVYDSNQMGVMAGHVGPRNRDVLTDLPEQVQIYGGKRGYYNMSDALNQVHGSIQEPGLRNIMRDTIIPQMLGRQTVQGSTENLIAHTTALGAKGLSSFLKNIKVDKTEFGKRVVKSLDDFVDQPAGFIGAAPRGGIARYLYMTHLGFNPAAVVLNLSQPWLLGSTWMGMGPTIQGYGKAFKEMGGYIAERVASGKLNIPDVEKARLIKKHFTHAESLGIGPDVLSAIDDIAFPVSPLAGSKTRMQRFSDTSLKIFEKGEWMNRLVTAHATDALYKKAGKFATTGPSYVRRMRDVQQMIHETQFGADFLNTPFVFMGHGKAGQILGRPEFRQFLTFPLRSATGLLMTSKQINEGRRMSMGFDVPFGRTADFVRGMGVSAWLHYAGRNMFEADMQKGLFYNSLTDIVGGDAFSDYENPTDFIPVPPFIDMGHDFVRGITSNDGDLIANSIWRAVPGGIALSRTMSSLPQAFNLPTDNPMGRLAQGFQRRYAAYDMKTPTGEVPVFKGDGTFLEFRNPMQLVLQGLGLDLNQSKVRSAETGYYVKQREMILDYRKNIITRLISNDISGAMSKKAEYEKRMGIPFSVTKEQIRQFLRNRNIPRDERILDRIPPKARHLYARYVAADMINKDVDPSVFVDAPTSTARSKILGRPQTFDLEPEGIEALKELMEQEQEQEHQRSMSFTEYVPYGFK
jgi:hypothetical protein